MADREPGIIKEFRELYEYVRLMGEHINQIHSRLDQLERNISEMKSTHAAYIETNRTGLEDVKKVIASKAEVNGLFQELNNSLSGSLPSLPVKKVEEPEVEEYQEEEREQEKSREEDRRRRFPFLRRFQE